MVCSSDTSLAALRVGATMAVKGAIFIIFAMTKGGGQGKKNTLLAASRRQCIKKNIARGPRARRSAARILAATIFDGRSVALLARRRYNGRQKKVEETFL